MITTFIFFTAVFLIEMAMIYSLLYSIAYVILKLDHKINEAVLCDNLIGITVIASIALLPVVSEIIIKVFFLN